MTVCIAMYCSREHCFVSVSDSMISMSDMSADNSAIKYKGLADKWVTMFAGNDVSDTTPIVEHVRNALASHDNVSLKKITEAFQEGFRIQVKAKAETTVLSKYDMDFPEFKQSGLNQFGPEMFSRIVYEIEEIAPDVTFLVYGFDEMDKHHIFTVEKRGEVRYFDVLGHWAIGSGQTIALGSIFSSRSPMIYSSLPDVLYATCKAKFNAETAPGVGAETTASILYSDGERHVIFDRDLRPLKEKWKALRQPDVPEECSQLAAHCIAEGKKSTKRAHKGSVKREAHLAKRKKSGKKK